MGALKNLSDNLMVSMGLHSPKQYARIVTRT